MSKKYKSQKVYECKLYNKYKSVYSGKKCTNKQAFIKKDNKFFG